MTLNKYVKYLITGLNCAIKPKKSFIGPIHLQIEPINDCNLRCLSCGRAKIVKKPLIMPLADFKKIIDQIKPIYLTLSGVGETLLHPKIDKMIKYCTDRNIFVNLTSNGTLLNEEWTYKICQSRLNLLSVSIDSTEKETYKSIRGFDLFEQLIDNLRNFIRYRDQNHFKKPSVRTHFVIQEKNYQQISSFIKLCHNLGVDAVYLQHLSLFNIEERKELLTGSLTKETVIRSLKQGLQTARELNFKNTNLSELIKKFDYYWEQYILSNSTDQKICLNPWFDAYINVDGSIQPCCAFGGNYNSFFGNALKDNFKKQFNGPNYTAFRQTIKAGKRPYKVCKNCHPISFTDILSMNKFTPGFLKRIIK